MEIILGQNGKQLGCEFGLNFTIYKYQAKIQAAQSSCYKCGGNEYQIRRCIRSSVNPNKPYETVHQSNCERNFTEPLIKVISLF